MREEIAEYLYDKVYKRVGCGGLDWKNLWFGTDLKYRCLKEADQILAITGEYEEVRWISVKDKLPSGQWNVNHPWLSEEVLIVNSCSINIGFYNREDETWYVDEPIKKEWIDKITHWMPLPINPHNKQDEGSGKLYRKKKSGGDTQ